MPSPASSFINEALAQYLIDGDSCALQSCIPKSKGEQAELACAIHELAPLHELVLNCGVRQAFQVEELLRSTFPWLPPKDSTPIMKVPDDVLCDILEFAAGAFPPKERDLTADIHKPFEKLVDLKNGVYTAGSEESAAYVSRHEGVTQVADHPVNELDEDQDCKLETTVKSVAREFQDELNSLFNVQSRFAPSFDLFPQVADYAPLILSHVCQRWRYVGITMANIWSAVYFHRPELVSMFLERAGQRPLHVILDLSAYPSRQKYILPQLFRLLIPRSARWHTFDFRAPSRDVACRTLSWLASVPAGPSLRKLSLFYPSSETKERRVHEEIQFMNGLFSSGGTPNLQALSLSGIGIGRSAFLQSPRLTHLQLEYLGAACLTWRQLATVLKSSRDCLETLYLTHIEPQRSTYGVGNTDENFLFSGDGVNSQGQLVLSAVNTLRLEKLSQDFLLTIVSWLCFPSIEKLAIDCSNDGDYHDDYVAALNVHVRPSFPNLVGLDVGAFECSEQAAVRRFYSQLDALEQITLREYHWDSGTLWFDALLGCDGGIVQPLSVDVLPRLVDLTLRNVRVEGSRLRQWVQSRTGVGRPLRCLTVERWHTERNDGSDIHQDRLWLQEHVDKFEYIGLRREYGPGRHNFDNSSNPFIVESPAWDG